MAVETTPERLAKVIGILPETVKAALARPSGNTSTGDRFANKSMGGYVIRRISK